MNTTTTQWPNQLGYSIEHPNGFTYEVWYHGSIQECVTDDTAPCGSYGTRYFVGHTRPRDEEHALEILESALELGTWVPVEETEYA